MSGNQTQPLHIIVNPAAGQGKGPACKPSLFHLECVSNNPFLYLLFFSPAPLHSHDVWPFISVLDEHIIPILNHFRQSYKVYPTTAPLHAGEIGRSILDSHRELGKGGEPIAGGERDEPNVVIIIGGDGTAHELIEGVTVDQQAENEDQGWGRWELIVLPFGTVSFVSL